MDKARVLVIDDDGGYVSAMRQAFARERLDDRFEIASLVPTEVDIIREAHGFILDEVEKEGEIAALLLDIVFQSRSAETNRSGIVIAEQVRGVLSEVPIVAVTDYSKIDALLVDVSFSLDFDGIVPKSLIVGDGFSARLFVDLLEKGRIRVGSRRQAKRNLHGASGSARKTERVASRDEGKKGGMVPSFARDLLTDYQVAEVGRSTLSHILQEVLGSGHASVRAFTPGFSGAFLFEADVIKEEPGESSSAEASWIVKVTRDHSKLEQELTRHAGLAVRAVPKDSYPALLVDDLIVVGDWAAMIMEKSADAVSLQEFLRQEPGEEALQNVLGDGVREFLQVLYGGELKDSANVWQKYYSISDRVAAKILWGIQGWLPALKALGGKETSQAVKTVESFVGSAGASAPKVLAFTRNVETRYIHGDFHSRNILVTPSTGGVTAIDFAKAGQGHAIRDIAKLEVDLVAGFLGSTQGRDTSWRELRLWRKLLEGLASEGSNGLKAITNAEKRLRVGGQALSEVRALAESVGVTFVWDEYFLSLLHGCLVALSYEDVPLPKKALCIELAHHLLKRFE